MQEKIKDEDDENIVDIGTKNRVFKTKGLRIFGYIFNDDESVLMRMD